MAEPAISWNTTQTPSFAWCVHSLRQAIAQYDPTTDRNLEITCDMSGVNVSRCDICFHSGESCDMVGIY